MPDLDLINERGSYITPREEVFNKVHWIPEKTKTFTHFKEDQEILDFLKEYIEQNKYISLKIVSPHKFPDLLKIVYPSLGSKENINALRLYLKYVRRRAASIKARNKRLKSAIAYSIVINIFSIPENFQKVRGYYG